MEVSENIYEMPGEEFNVYDEVSPVKNSRKGLKSSLQNQRLTRTVKITCFVNVIIFLSIGSVVTVVLMKLSVLEDDHKSITKTLNTLVQGIDSQNDGNNLSFCSSDKGCEMTKDVGSKFRCYKVETNETTWHNAVKMCQNIGGFLAEVTDCRSGEYLKRVVATGRPDLWLGASDESNEGVWIWATSEQNITYSDWRKGEPNNVKAKEHCLIIQYQWVDVPCNSKRGYICQSDRDDTCDNWV